MMILLTGGSACGKSMYAERLAAHAPLPRYYIAAMRPYGEESLSKIARHRQMRRDKGFETIERYTDLEHLQLPARGTVLLECICNLTANEMFDDSGNWRDPCDAVLRGVDALRARCDILLVVTNDVGSDGGAYEEGTRAYIAVMGRINCALAQRADCVLELVCGIPLALKGEIPVLE